MSSDETINKLKSLAPVITNVTATSDMGYEFSAVVPNGVIYAETGMLLNYSGGVWPLKQCEGKTDNQCEKQLSDFLLDFSWMVTPWENVSNEELEQWLADIIHTQS